MTDTDLEPWRATWRRLCRLRREGGEYWITDAALARLALALASDDPCLTQGDTAIPGPLGVTFDWPADAACLVGYCGWGEGDGTVGDIEGFFQRAVIALGYDADMIPAVVPLLNWWDETPRAEAFALMRPEVAREREMRAAEAEARAAALLLVEAGA